MKIFVKLNDNNKVVEACPQELDGGIEVSCTQEKYDLIFWERYDAYSDGVKITTVEAGEDNSRLLEQRALESQGS